MINLFRPKTMRRMAVFMALVAPIVYLFGSMFFALNGSHGGFPFSADYQVIVDSKVVDFNQKVLNGDFSDESNWIGYQASLTFGNGYADVVQNSTSTLSGLVSNTSKLVYQHVYYCRATVQNLDSVARQFSIGGAYNYSSYVLEPNEIREITWRGSVSSYSSNYITFCIGNRQALNVSIPFQVTAVNVFDLTQNGYSGDATEDFLNDFPNVFYPYVDSENVIVDVYGVPDNSQFLFDQFFPKDNFLVHWGENALSDNPYGFAPFGYFWRYLDTNVLHLSNDQVGLMAYGYMYYAAHVLLFDVGFMLVTFFLTFIQKVGDKIGGEER